jgi:hypothetical protein
MHDDGGREHNEQTTLDAQASADSSAQRGHAQSYQASQVILYRQPYMCLPYEQRPVRTFSRGLDVQLLGCMQGHIGQQPLDAVPAFGGSTSSGTEGSYRLWDPSKVPTPSKIVAALDKFVVGQEATKKVGTPLKESCFMIRIS